MTSKSLPVLNGPWSYSRATACSLALYKDRVLRLPPEPRPERLMSIDRTLLGTACHVGASLLLRARIGQPVPEDDFPWRQETRELVDSGRCPDNRSLASEIVTSYSELAPQVDDLEARFRLFVNRFRVEGDMTLEERDAFLRDSIIVCEHAMAVTATGAPTNYASCPADGWRGKIDYAEDSGDGLLTVIDFKNRPAMFSDGELKTNEQLSVYLWLVTCHYPQFTRFRVGIYYFQFGVTQLVDISREEMLANVARLRARAAHKATLTADTVAPEPGFGKCQYCDYLMSCSAGNLVLEPSILVPTDQESAMATARWLVVNEERVKAARSALKAFTQEHGSLQLDDETCVGFSASEKTRYDKDKTLRALKSLIEAGKLDAKLSLFTSLNLGEVKKAAKAEVVDKALEQARYREVETEFEVFRPKKRVSVKPGAKEPGDRKVRGRVKSAARR